MSDVFETCNLINQYIEESAHKEYKETFNELKSKYTSLNKEFTQLVKSGKISEASKKLDEIDHVIDKYESVIEDIDSDELATVCSWICQNLVHAIKANLIGIGIGVGTTALAGAAGAAVGSASTQHSTGEGALMGALMGAAVGSPAGASLGGTVAWVSYVVDTLKSLTGIINSCKKSDGNITSSDLNMYRGKLMTSINNMRKINDKKRDIINKYKDKPTKESVNTKLNIYEAYDNGYITESEKDELFNILEKANNGNVDLSHFSSSILNPEKIFKTSDNHYYIDASKCPDITSDVKLQRTISKAKNVAIASMMNLVKELYDRWYDEDDEKSYLKLSEVCKLMHELFDVIEVRDNGKYIGVGYWINSFSSHKNSSKFFLNHSMNVYYRIDKETYKYVEDQKPQLEG